MGPQPKTIEERFWKKVLKTKKNKCWEWSGALDGGGYGSFRIGSMLDGTRKKVRAHRVAWELTNGPVPAGYCVLHRCDNPKCVRPDHLFLGTQRDNVLDMIKKNRDNSGFVRVSTIGVNNAKAKLAERDVLKIRELAAKGDMTHSEIAKLFGVTRNAISCVISRKTWVHI